MWVAPTHPWTGGFMTFVVFDRGASLDAPLGGDEAAARLPIPDFLKTAAAAANGEPGTESD